MGLRRLSQAAAWVFQVREITGRRLWIVIVDCWGVPTAPLRIARKNNMAKRSAQKMADELFALVETDQGKGFISDGYLGSTPEAVLRIARISLQYTERSARKLRKWIRKYTQE